MEKIEARAAVAIFWSAAARERRFSIGLNREPASDVRNESDNGRES
jgi:hypothetical protein